MTVRFDNLPLDNTRATLLQIMPKINEGERVLFLTPAGEGEKIEQRIRVMLSRARARMKRRGRKMSHFKLHCTVHPHTEQGTRYDAVVMWRSRNVAHVMSELLEDMLSHDS